MSAPQILVLDTLIEQLLQVIHDHVDLLLPVVVHVNMTNLGHKDESAVTVDVVEGKVGLKENKLTLKSLSHFFV